MGEEKTIGSHELKKHVATIHCSNTLTLLQRKITNALLYHAYKELLLKEEHEITVKQLCQLISYHGNNHSVIKQALKGLLSTVIEWNVVDDVMGVEDWTASSILASVSLRGPLCTYAYSPRMKRLLHSPSMFGKINLLVQAKFKSNYGLALYENCIRYRGLPFTKWFDVDMFRKLMGVPTGKYTVFRDFKRRVLDKSIEEINSYSDLVVEPELFREGKKVLKIRFALKERPKKTRLGSLTKNSDSDVEIPSTQSDPQADIQVQLMEYFGLGKDQAEQLLQEYSLDFIKEKMCLVEESKSYQQGKVQNIAAYLISAVKNNYQLAKANTSVLKKKHQQSQKQFDHQQAERKVEKIRESYLAYREQAIDMYIAGLKEEEKHVFLTEFNQFAATSIKTILSLQRGKYTEETILTSPPIKALLRQFALQTRPNLEASVVSWEGFVESVEEE